jgi:pyruvate dehydrogenase E2 component (dihydrolipoamide acetyltransferase)
MDLTLPRLGEGVESGTVVSVLVKPGDQIRHGQTIIELETEKAVAPIPAAASGRITKLYVKAGDTISVGQPILAIEAESAEPVTAAAAAAPAAVPGAVTGAAPAPVAPVAPVAPPVAAAVAASPTVRKLARDLGIDLTRVRGTEAGGRIGLADLRNYIQWLQQQAAAAAAPVAAPAAPPTAQRVDFSKWGPVTRQPLGPVRRVIAERMHESWTRVPRVTQFDEADITGLNELRKKHNLTLTPFLIRAVVVTLKKHPIFNASLDEAAGEIVFKQYYHIGVAVDTEHGLLVPVIRDADTKSIPELARELQELAALARQRKLAAEQMKGGTFTISNQGGIGGGAFTPIVNLPEVAILGVGRAACKPVVREGKIEPRLILPLALSYDHRLIDGGSAARFMVDLVAAVQGFDEAGTKL